MYLMHLLLDHTILKNNKFIAGFTTPSAAMSRLRQYNKRKPKQNSTDNSHCSPPVPNFIQIGWRTSQLNPVRQHTLHVQNVKSVWKPYHKTALLLHLNNMFDSRQNQKPALAHTACSTSARSSSHEHKAGGRAKIATHVSQAFWNTEWRYNSTSSHSFMECTKKT